MFNPIRSIANGISGAIVLLGLVLAFLFGPFNLPIFFIALAFSALVSSFGSLNPRRIYSGIQGFMWLLMLALFFATGSWLWFLVGGIFSAILGALFKPITAILLGLGIFGLASMTNNQQSQQQQPYYQPTQQQPYYQPTQQQYYTPPTSPPPQTYEQGYQGGAQTPASYQEGRQSYPVPMQYEQPQAQYPTQIPPPQQ